MLQQLAVVLTDAAEGMRRVLDLVNGEIFQRNLLQRCSVREEEAEKD